MRIVFTVCNRHQLRQALTLGESLLRHNPEHRFILGWTDSPPLYGMPDWVRVIPIEELALTRLPWMDEHYYDFELVAACKPFFGRYILNQFPECTELIYLAPCIWIVGSLDGVLEPGVFFQATPHRLRPISAPDSLDDKAILNIGMYHAGSWVLHPDGQEKELMDWWCERTSERGFFDLCHGMCLDQLWMNYLPVLFNGVHPIRNAGWHYGLHALPGHQLSRVGNAYLIDQQPLIFVDFSGVECYHPVWTNYAASAYKVPHWSELRGQYKDQLSVQKVPALSLKGTPHGKVSHSKLFRAQRKKIIHTLERLIDRIATYDLTHN